MSSRRQKQVNQAIRRELSDLLTRQVRDPRINGIISITEVDISPDLKQAKVYVSVMGSEEEKAEVFAGIDSASDYLRHELGRRIKMRYVPGLIFRRDDSIEKAEHMLRLIDQSASDTPDN
ncbi:MAG: 30S ribosome-binding factor RbfA [Dehalococcoidia bacterium]